MTVTLVVVIPLLMAAVLLATWNFPKFRRRLSLAGMAAHLFISAKLLMEVADTGIVKAQLGGWPTPFGIAFSADLLSAMLIVVASIIGFTLSIYSTENIDDSRRDFGFHPLFFVLVAGVCGAFVTGDLFNMFVWFECILLSSFVLLALGGEKPQIRGALNYVIPNLFSSMMFLCGLGLLYGVTGTLNMADLAIKTGQISPSLLTIISLFFLTAFGIKAAIFPFFAWLPTSYHTPPVAVTALFAGLLTKVGVYALVRYFTLIGPLDNTIIQSLMLWGAVGTMVFGALGAVSQRDVKRVLAYLLISHIGYMIAGLAMGKTASLGGTIYYMLHHIVVITALFYAAGIIEHHLGSTQFKHIGGLLKTRPYLAAMFFIPMLGLIGIPPLSGFWPKIVLLQTAFANGFNTVGIAMIFASLITLYCMARIWMEAFWKPKPDFEADFIPERPMAKYLPTGALTLIIILLGVAAGPMTKASQSAAQQLRDAVPFTITISEKTSP